MINPPNLSKKEIIELLNTRGEEQEQLHQQAREARAEVFGDVAFIRAIIEPSNYCRNKCLYCAMGDGRNIVNRYRMSVEEIVSIAEAIAKHGITTFSLETGEDPRIIDTLVQVTRIFREKDYSMLGIIGNHSEDDFRRLVDAGLTSFLLKFETSNPDYYRSLRPKTELKKRLADLDFLKELGCAIGTGNIVGLPGQTIDSMAEDILLAQQIDPEMVSAAPFIPSPKTPLQNAPYGNIDLTLNTLALYRILLPNTQIPSLCALNHYGAVGQLGGLNAGANDILINTATPDSKASEFAIYSKRKLYVTLEQALDTIEKAGLHFDSDAECSLYK